MHQRLGRSAPWVIAAIVILAIVASAVLLMGALSMQRQMGDEVRRHSQNLLTLRRTQGLLVDAETGQRGFLLTSDADFLQPYERAREQIPSHLHELVAGGVVPAGDPLEKLSAAKLEELGFTIGLFRRGDRSAALAVVEDGRGKIYMDAIRAEVRQRTAREQKLIDSAIRRSERYAGRVYGALALLAVSAAALIAFGIWLLMRNQQLQGEAVRLRDAEEAERRTALVARELSHRVKNLFSVVLGIVHLAGKGAGTPEEAAKRIGERVEALARAHQVSLGRDPMSGFDLETMLGATLAPYASDVAKLELGGPAVQLSSSHATPVGLIVHELATNALKYGAWSSDGGKVALEWSVHRSAQRNGTSSEDVLRLRWTELGTREIRARGKAGFGSQLIDAAVAQLGGSMKRETRERGIRVSIEAPVVPKQPAGAAPSDNP